MTVIASLVAAYLLGAIPFSLVIGQRVKGIDLREHGSGNLGATNVYRNLGKGWGGLCLLLDAAKGVAAVLLMTLVVDAIPRGEALPLHLTGDVWRILAGAAAILGHSFSPFVRFKGGKGIATTFGVFLILEPLAVLLAFAVFVAVFLATRIVSLGSLSAAAVFPWAVLIFELRSRSVSVTLIVFSAIIAALVIWRHRANIRRLRAGTEQQLRGPEDDADPPDDPDPDPEDHRS
jgi:glycerol-3-phosphate acyltransferase PlsY